MKSTEKETLLPGARVVDESDAWENSVAFDPTNARARPDKVASPELVSVTVLAFPDEGYCNVPKFNVEAPEDSSPPSTETVTSGVAGAP